MKNSDRWMFFFFVFMFFSKTDLKSLPLADTIIFLSSWIGFVSTFIIALKTKGA